MDNNWQGLEEIPAGFGPAVVTVGNFDGVHLGHQKILRTVAESARQRSIASVALTFDPHPLKVLAPALAPQTLTGMPQRIGLIRGQGIDHVAVLPFTRKLSLLSPRAFVEQVLAGKLGANHVIVGGSFRFGRDQAGDTETLRSLGVQLGFEVILAGTVVVGGEAVSSTRVRSLVRQGHMAQARRLLGREFSLCGPIVKGEGIGSKRTVPTLNLAPQSQVLPADGVYITVTRQPGADFCRESITNVGLRPTFDGRQRTVETFLLGTLEGAAPDTIELGFLRKVRDERKFPSAQLLREQIGADIEVAARFFQRLRTVSRHSTVASR